MPPTLTWGVWREYGPERVFPHLDLIFAKIAFYLRPFGPCVPYLDLIVILPLLTRICEMTAAIRHCHRIALAALCVTIVTGPGEASPLVIAGDYNAASRRGARVRRLDHEFRQCRDLSCFRALRRCHLSQ